MYRLIRTVLPLCALAMATAGIVSAQNTVETKKLPMSFFKGTVPHTARSSDAIVQFGTHKGGGIKAAATVGIPGVDTLVNWSDQFVTPGYDYNGNFQSVWPYTMVGTPPESGMTSNIHAPVIPITLDLLGADGKVALYNGTALSFSAAGKITNAVLNSPVFETYSYPSGQGQFNDQMMRTQFWDRIHRSEENEDNGWHIFLQPSVKTTRHMQIPFGFWYFFTDANNVPIGALVDENTFGNLLFPSTYPFDNSTPVGAAENAGEMTTKDISTFLFNNVYLYGGTINNCCILGFHSYDFEPGIPSNGNRVRFYVMNYSSWISPGLFGGPEDITALSHELSETFDDPLIDNQTPWWLSLDPFSMNGLCQDNLEVGDVVEVLTYNTTYAAGVDGRTYHPQNVALLPWFAFQSPSHARNGTYSFPDETTLMSLSPGPLLPNCKPAP
jgi:hypothetical protein